MMAEGRLRHRFVDGEVGIDGFLDDYAYAAWGLLELHQAIGAERYLQAAHDVSGKMIAHFWNQGSGGFFFTADDAESVIARRMEGYDGAMPSGNSVAAYALARLSAIEGDRGLRDRAWATVRAFAADINAAPFAHAQMLQAIMLLKESEG
jgi:uncharacterized protein YyaL (SSP411 family)